MLQNKSYKSFVNYIQTNSNASSSSNVVRGIRVKAEMHVKQQVQEEEEKAISGKTIWIVSKEIFFVFYISLACHTLILFDFQLQL